MPELLAQSDHDLQCMNDARNPTEDGEQDVDEQVAAAATLKEDTEGWQYDRQEDFQDVSKMQMLLV